MRPRLIRVEDQHQSGDAARALGAAKVPHDPVTDLCLREKLILATIVAAVFALGLYPNEPMRKTELAAKEFQQRVSAAPIPASKP